MSIRLCILASGSSGNCAILHTPAGCVLIDCGIGPRTLDQRLAGSGLCGRNVHAIVLTHLDADHFKPVWLRTIARRGIRVYCHRRCFNPLLAHDRQHRESTAAFARFLRVFDQEPFEPLPGLRFEAIPLAHDEAGSHGFVIEGFGCRVGYATDLGRVTDELIERFRELDLLALECNYDPDLQRASGRPWFLQQRIMGGRGHLSNRQCFDAVSRIFDRDRAVGRVPQHVVLLHRSRQCNCPMIVRGLFAANPPLAERLVLAEQFQPTAWLCIDPFDGLRFETELFAAGSSA
jgi:phosphoribosyl 1,2-cyclic phosphodiesterase